MKTTEEMIEVMQAHLRGEKIEHEYEDGVWNKCPVPLWNWSAFDYRIAPKPAPTQDTIPWDAIDELFQWAARDEDGEFCVYSACPSQRGVEWRGMDRQRLTRIVKIIPGTVDWRESLQERPAAEEKRP